MTRKKSITVWTVACLVVLLGLFIYWCGGGNFERSLPLALAIIMSILVALFVAGALVECL